jgi:hypothetical protein
MGWRWYATGWRSMITGCCTTKAGGGTSPIVMRP